jgi:hypothetical protein
MRPVPRSLLGCISLLTSTKRAHSNPQIRNPMVYTREESPGNTNELGAADHALNNIETPKTASVLNMDPA